MLKLSDEFYIHWSSPRKKAPSKSRITALRQKDFYMKHSRYSDSQIIAILKQAESGTPVPSLCREHGMSSATFYKWRTQYGGMEVSMMTRLKELELENKRLKKRYADAKLDAEIVKEALVKKW